MEDFESELKVSFLEEAEQLLTDVEKCYLDLETNPNDASILDQIFRVAHNLKGSSKAVGFVEVGQFAHQFENLLLKLKNGELTINPKIVNVLLRSNDHLAEMIHQLKENIEATFDSSELLEQIREAIEHKLSDEIEESLSLPDETTTEQASTSTTLEDVSIPEEVPSTHIETPIAHAAPPPEASEATISLAPISPSSPATPPAPKSNGPPQSTSEESIRVSLARLEKLLNYVGEMVILQTVLREQAQSSNDLLRKTVHQLGKVTKEVQDISMSLRMVPLKATFQKMQRIVRDTSQDLGKKVVLFLEGEETELDKTILERVNDPLVHLIRNACDHGIESAEIRKNQNKPEQGHIRLSAYHQNGKLVIEVSDDGGGINPEVLKQKAIEKKILSPGVQISDQEAINLVFHPGFSTKAVVTDVSGRGVGMDVVKHNIESLQGEVLVETKLHEGTTFKIILPLTLAIIDAMVVKAHECRYVIPLSHVHESVKLSKSDIKTTSGLGEILLLRGETVPLFRLTQLLERKVQQNAEAEMIALVIQGTSDPFAVLVDDIIGQYQVVIKQLGAELQAIRGFSGSSILGDGKPALILELAELVAKGKKLSVSPSRGIAA